MQLISGCSELEREACDSGIIEARMATVDTKHIYFLGVHHKAGTDEGRRQQLSDFVDAIKETANDRQGGLHVLFEKPIGAQDRTLYHALQKAVQGSLVKDVTFEDAEIRKISIPANDRLKKPFTYLTEEAFTLDITFDKDDEFMGTPAIHIKPREKLTFKHLLDEYDTWYTVLRKFREKFPTDDHRFYGFDRHWKDMVESYDELMHFLRAFKVELDEGIALAAAKFHRNHDQKVATENIKQLKKLIRKPFSHLFDFVLFKKVYEFAGNYIAIVGGAKHTTSVLSMYINGFNALDGPNRVVNPYESYFTDKPSLLKLANKKDLIAVLKGSSFPHLKLVSVILGIIMVCLNAKLSNEPKQTESRTHTLDSQQLNGLKLRLVKNY